MLISFVILIDNPIHKDRDLSETYDLRIRDDSRYSNLRKKRSALSYEELAAEHPDLKETVCFIPFFRLISS